MRLHILTLAFAVMISAAPAGERSQPKSPKAVAAAQKFQLTMTQASAAHQKAEKEATKTLVAELKAAQKIAFKNEDSAEVNAIDAAIANAGNPTSDLRESLPGKEWHHSDKVAGKYSADGTFRFGTATGHWEIIDANTIRQKEDGGTVETVTFNTSRTMGFWVYEHSGSVGWAKRDE